MRSLDLLGLRRAVRRLHLVTNNARFLMLPGGPPDLGSRLLSLCTRRLIRDWPARFGHEMLLADTFVEPARIRGTVCRVANWIEVGRTRSFVSGEVSYSAHASPMLVFLWPHMPRHRIRLQRNARWR